MTTQGITEEAQGSLLALLRTRGASIKDLDDERRERLREFLDYLHNTRGMSLNDIAKLIGNKTSGYTSWVCRQLGVPRRPFEEARLKGIREKRRKYERKPFDGTDEDRAYLLGLRHGDLSVSTPWKGVVRVSTSTTHPAMAQLFRSSFGPYGHVYQHPRYKKDTKTYEWNLFVIVDNSFVFLLNEKPKVWEWVSKKESTLIAYIGGMLDAEGSIGIYNNHAGTSLQGLFYNTNRELLTFIKTSLERLGFHPLGPYLDKSAGTSTSKYGIVRRKDYWKLVLAIFGEVQDLVREVPIRHREKVLRKEIALSINPGQKWATVEPRVLALRCDIRSGRDDFLALAETEFKKKHPSLTGEVSPVYSDRPAKAQ